MILAAILSFYYISRYRTLNDKFSLFLGIGFLTNGLIDLLHVIVSYNLINEPLFLKYFIPQTWFAGRLFLSAMFAMAIAGYPILSRKEDFYCIFFSFKKEKTRTGNYHLLFLNKAEKKKRNKKEKKEKADIID